MMREGDSEPRAGRILIVEDDLILAEYLASCVRDLGFFVTGIAGSAKEALGFMDRSPADLVIMDIRLPGDMDGVDTAGRIVRYFDVPVVYVTGCSEREVQERVAQTSHYGYLNKPVTFPALKSAIEKALYKHEADKRVRESDERYRIIVETANEGVWVVDENDRTTYMNERMAEMLGISPEEALGSSPFDFVDDDVVEQLSRHRALRRDGVREQHELRYRRRDGSQLWAMISSCPVYSSVGTFKGSFAMVTDITERKRWEEALTASEETYRQMFERNNAVKLLVDPENGAIVDANPAAVDFYGYSREKLLRSKITDINCLPAEQVFQEMSRAVSQSMTHLFFKHRLASSEERDVEVYSGPVDVKGRKLLYSIIHDITERIMAENRIKESLREKEVLLREIHHRVKNNLAVINSLINLQAEFVGAKAPRELLADIQARVRSMALAHELLYQSDNLAKIPVVTYVESLIGYLASSVATMGTMVEISNECEDISFGPDTVMPLGFILTELVVNSLKHAFVGRDYGTLFVSIQSLGGGQFELVLADDGVGLSEDVDFDRPQSLGLELVRTFVDQLHGSLSVSRGAGTKVTIRFQEK